MAVNSTRAVEREIRIAAAPDVVFEFFVDPAKMLRWKGTTAELDPRPGGLYRVNVTGREVTRGEYVEIVPHSRIVFTWGWEGEGSPVPPGCRTRGLVGRVRRSDRLQGDAGCAGPASMGPDTWVTTTCSSNFMIRKLTNSNPAITLTRSDISMIEGPFSPSCRQR